MRRTNRGNGSSDPREDDAVVFGVYHYSQGDKYWECLPIKDEDGSTLYQIRWWHGDDPPERASRHTSTVIVERAEAVRRVKALMKGGYVLHSALDSDKSTNLLEWMLE